MRKLVRSLTLSALVLTSVGGFAATKVNVYKTVPKTTSGRPIPTIQGAKFEPRSLAQFKAQNHLSYAASRKILANAGKAKKNGFISGIGNTVPYFQAWFITGSRNSIYPYSMVGGVPTNGGTTVVDTQLIPLISVLQVGGVTVAVYDPTVANDPQGDDIALVAQSPIYDATTTYPGPPADTGQIVDTAQRVAFHTYGNWHTHLVSTSSGIVWTQFLEYNNGDWTTASLDGVNYFPVFNINTISNNFEYILFDPMHGEHPLNTTVPVIVTDYLTAFDPLGGCCTLGYHTAQNNTDANGPGISAWTWGTYLPQSDNPFSSFSSDVAVLTHEVSELINDPFVNTNVSPYVDGSATFAQGNLETGDCIEAMNIVDSLYQVPLVTGGGPYTYNLQNTCTLDWFRRNPFNGGIYSWPNEHTLGQAPHPVGCNTFGVCWSYGQGSAGFYFGPPY